ncbi:MAG: heavy metal translocating P-type ATPase [Rhodobacteraceae bacterium]|nr:heavy metal translocating P-type ATPase [Paracoccaceae bacterium]
MRKSPSAGGGSGRQEFIFAVQDMHCAACISAVENSLSKFPGVVSARVNLTHRRVMVEAIGGTDACALVRQIEQVGYSARRLDASVVDFVSTDPETQELLVRLGVAGFGFANVMIFSVVIWSGAEGTTRDLMHWLSALVAVPITCYSAQPFLFSALRSLRRFRLNMDVPISLAILLAAGHSLFETALGGQHAYFEAALALTFFLLAGRYLDLHTRSSARSAAQQLSALEPDQVTVKGTHGEREAPLSSVHKGQVIVVRAGDRIPLDGTVRSGSSDVDNSFLTGESRPVPATVGSAVAAGQFVHTGRLEVEVACTGEDSSLRKLIRLIHLAESAKSSYTGLAERAASVYAPAVHLLALAGFSVWMYQTGDVRLSMNIAVAVLIITCPCALGLAVPAVSTATVGRLFRSQLLIKDSDALERLAEVRTTVLDKTGTLTMNVPSLDNSKNIDDEAWSVAGALAGASRHPYARAIHEHVQGRGIEVAEVRDVVERPGLGVAGVWKGNQVKLGRAGWVGTKDNYGTATFLRLDSERIVAFRFVDQLRSGVQECVEELHSLGSEVILLSGDADRAVREMATRLNVRQWHAEALPEDKLDMIRKYTMRGGSTLMVGDGLNDAAALALADVSIAPSSAIDATRVSAGIVLVGGDLKRIPEGIKLARLAKRRILENFAIAACYNAVAVPLALAGIATPLMAAIAMSTSSIAVTLNSMRMR